MAKRIPVLQFLVAIALLGLGLTARAQTSCYTNPSMEGPTVPHQVPSPWLACYGSPDTQPGNWGFTQPASNGNSYVSFLHSGQSPTGYKEGMTQLLNPCLLGGTTYTITVDLAHSPIYNTAGPGNCPSSFAMYGGNSSCAISETLLVSGPITHTNWVTYTFTFTPTQNFCYISFAPYFTGSCTGYINIMIDNFTCIQPALVNATSTPESCPGSCTGTATANVTQGVPPYTYSWAPGGQTTPSLSNLCQGSYTVTVTDNAGQQASSTTTVGGPQAFNTTVTGANVSCFGQNNGTANIVAMGGTAPYTYSWSPSGLNVFNPAGLSAGTHVVTVTDAAGCTTTDSISLTEPPALVGNIASSTPALCFNSNSGTITGTASGGTPPYTYTWTPGGNGQTLFNALANQVYTLNVTDAMGCLVQVQHQITQPTQLVGGIINPIQPSCFGNNNGSLTSNVSGGTPPYSYFWNPTGQTTPQAINLSAGNHSLMVIDANGCMVNVSFPLSQPSLLSVGIPSFTNLTCFNSANGTASAMVGGGTPPYSYLWSPSGSTVSNPSNLSAGTHTLTVTDSRGCTATASRTLTQPPAIVPILQQMQPASCFGGNNGSLSVQVSGGVPGYSYSWTPNVGNGLNPTGLSSGSYQLTVTDQNNCTQTASYSVTQPNLLQANAQMLSGPLCHGDTNAVLQASAQGGVAPYSYLWNNGQTGPNFGSAGLTMQRCAAAYGRHDLQAVRDWFMHGMVMAAFSAAVLIAILLPLATLAPAWLGATGSLAGVLTAGMLVAGAGAALTPLNDTARGMLCGLQRNGIAMGAEVVAGVIGLAFTLSAVFFGWGIAGLAWGSALRILVALAINGGTAALYVSKAARSTQWSSAMMGEYGKTLVPLWSSSVVVQMLLNESNKQLLMLPSA